MNEYIIAGIGLLATIVSGWTSWFFTRKKYNSEVDNSIIDGMQHSLDFYKTLSDDNKTRLDEMVERSSKIEEENKLLKAENKSLKERQEELEKMIIALKKQVDELLSKDSVITESVKELKSKVSGKTKGRKPKTDNPS